MPKYRHKFAQAQTEVVECIMVKEVRHGTPAGEKDSLQEYVHQNPIKLANTIKIRARINRNSSILNIKGT